MATRGMKLFALIALCLLLSPVLAYATKSKSLFDADQPLPEEAAVWVKFFLSPGTPALTWGTLYLVLLMSILIALVLSTAISKTKLFEIGVEGAGNKIAGLVAIVITLIVLKFTPFAYYLVIAGLCVVLLYILMGFTIFEAMSKGVGAREKAKRGWFVLTLGVMSLATGILMFYLVDYFESLTKMAFEEMPWETFGVLSIIIGIILIIIGIVMAATKRGGYYSWGGGGGDIDEPDVEEPEEGAPPRTPAEKEVAGRKKERRKRAKKTVEDIQMDLLKYYNMLKRDVAQVKSFEDILENKNKQTNAAVHHVVLAIRNIKDRRKIEYFLLKKIWDNIKTLKKLGIEIPSELESFVERLATTERNTSGHLEKIHGYARSGEKRDFPEQAIHETIAFFREEEKLVELLEDWFTKLDLAFG